METILASIRRIIREDDVDQPAETGAGSPSDEEDDELLVLEPSMVSQAPQPGSTHSIQETRMSAGSVYGNAAQTAADLAAALFDEPEPLPAPSVPVRAEPQVSAPVVVAAPSVRAPASHAIPPVEVVPVATQAGIAETMEPRPTLALMELPDETLLAPETRAAAAQSFAALQDAVRPERAEEMKLLRTGSLTLEDIVRHEVRGQLKNWLDANLPELVERVVRQEIGRLVRPG